MVPSLSPHFLSLDLEVGKQDHRIRAFAAVRPDIDHPLVFHGGDLAAALAKLDDFAAGADFLLGHNLIAFDLPHLKAAEPVLRMLKLPAVDTLWLNPLAFPRNPYHHLVKHYQDGQIKRGRLNDPELDARLALEVFGSQQTALRDAPLNLLAAWHYLTGTGSRYDKTGALTVVISPLVALMADQVAGLEAHGIGSCVAINGLLSMPERADALDRVRLGDAGILIISPEQLRNLSLHRVLDQREIGAWVLDEAHCLSKWGPRLPARLSLRGALHPRKGRTEPDPAGSMPDRDGQT